MPVKGKVITASVVLRKQSVLFVRTKLASNLGVSHVLRGVLRDLSHVLHGDVEAVAEVVAEAEDGDGDLGLTNSYRAGESWLFFNVWTLHWPPIGGYS